MPQVSSWSDAERVYRESIAYSLDPGGLVYTAEDPGIAAKQAKMDIGGYGAKSTVATREKEKQYKAAAAKAAEAAAKEAKLIEAQQGIEAERKRRMDERRRRRIERGSLLYGMDTGMGETLG